MSNEKILISIARCEDADLLRVWITNARAKNEPEVADAAFRQLASLVPEEQPDTVEHDFWQAINALEASLWEERGKKTRLTRTRQKISRVGVVETMAELATRTKPGEGFDMLVERGMPELTAEAVILRHPDKFDKTVQTAARVRLEKAGVDLDLLAEPLDAGV